MFILTRTFRNKKITISAVTIETTFFSAPLPIKGLLFFFLNNMFKYDGTLYRNRIQDVYIDTYTPKIRKKNGTLYRNRIQQEHRKERYTQQLLGIFVNKAEESYILTVI